jgi:hypothetical protein
MAHSVLEQVATARRGKAGAPYIVIENALPEAYYAELAAAYPPLRSFVADEAVSSNKAFRLPAVRAMEDAALPACWREFITYHTSAAFFREMVDFWAPEIARLYPDFADNFGKPPEDFSVGLRQPGKEMNPANRAHDVLLDCQPSINTPVLQASSVRGVHLDSRFKLFAGLLYFRRPDDEDRGGNLEFYRLKPGGALHPRTWKIAHENVELIDTIPYRPNTLVMFLNSPLSIHGVSPRGVTPVERRYVNLLAECYRGRRDDYLVPREPWRAELVRRAGQLWRRLKLAA